LVHFVVDPNIFFVDFAYAKHFLKASINWNGS
jgi:hypothetical protein